MALDKPIMVIRQRGQWEQNGFNISDNAQIVRGKIEA
jgi:hypothetical protein